MRSLRAFLVLSAFFALTFPLMPLQLLFVRTGSRYARTFPHWYHRQVCRIVGIRLNCRGRDRRRQQGVLIIANHVSWLDITVLSAVAPVSFVAKQEVASWPFVSWLAKLQRSVFVDRNRRNEVGDKANEILERLAAGDHIVLFAEGTSSDGNSVVPFKTALFAAAKPVGGAPMGAKVSAQTLALTYPKIYGLPLCRRGRHVIAWYGDMDMASHAWRLLGLGPDRRAYPHRTAGSARCISPTARRSPATPRTRCARTWSNCCAGRRRRKRGQRTSPLPTSHTEITSPGAAGWCRARWPARSCRSAAAG